MMAGWKSEKREFIEHRWVLRQPVRDKEMVSVLDAANRQWVSVDPSGRSDITVRGEDDHIIVAFTAPRVTGKRGVVLDVFETGGEDE